MLKRAAKKVDIFQGLDPKQLEELLGWFDSRRYPAMETIFEEGQEPVGLYLLCSGTVGVVKHSSRGRFRLAEVEAPSFFGEMGLLSEDAHCATIRAQSNVSVGQLPRRLFKDKLRQYNRTALLVSLNIARLLTARLDSADREIARLRARIDILKKGSDPRKVSKASGKKRRKRG